MPKLYSFIFCLILCLGLFLLLQTIPGASAEKNEISSSQGFTGENHEKPESDVYSQSEEIDHNWWAEYKFDTSVQAMDSLPREQQILKKELGFLYDADHYLELAKKLLALDRIFVGDDNFLDLMLVIAAYQDRFQGREIKLSGFVYRDLAMSSNELAITREAVTCCPSHASLYGILLRGENLDRFEEDSWITVRGVVDQTFIFDQNMLMVTALEAEKIAVPDSPYVYPYLYRQHMP